MKRCLSIFLSAAMILGMFPASVAAEEDALADSGDASTPDVEIEEIVLDKSTLGNPISGFDGDGNLVYGGDPTMFVDGDTVYLYVGHDDTSSGGGYTMPNWLCYSSTDMVSWTYHGPILNMTDISWADNVSAWASQMTKYNGSYWLFYCAEKPGTGKCVGAAKSESPTGPFVDQGVLISAGMTNTATYVIGDTTAQALYGRRSTFGHEDIDPTVWIEEDENGEEHIYLMWGNSNCWMCELTSDMKVKDQDGNGVIEQGEDKDIWFQNITGIERIPANGNLNDIVDFTEAPWLYRRKTEDGTPYGKYYMFFATHWREEMAYATTDDITSNQWEYGGKLMEPNATANTNHPAVIDFKGKTYFVYHNGSLPGGSGYRRVVCVEEMEFNEDGSIDYIQETSTGLSGTATQIFCGDGTPIAHENFMNPLEDTFYPQTGKLVYPASNAKTANALWEIEPGKADKDNDAYVTIEAYNKPGMYLTVDDSFNVVLSHDHNNDQAAAADGTTVDSDYMTFRTLKGFDGEGVTFESVAYPGYYITATASGLELSKNPSLEACSFDLQDFTGSVEEESTTPDTRPRRLANFTFDDETSGFASKNAYAVGRYSLEDHNDGKALYLDGSSKNYLSVFAPGDRSLLAGAEEITVSLWAKPTAGNTNWLFYAAKNENAPTYSQERYLGILDKSGSILAERYANTGTRPTTATAAVDGDEWYHLAVVHTKAETVIYINGEEAAREASDYALTDILEDGGALYIGKAPWGGGEYYTGLIDDLCIYNYALTAEQIGQLSEGEQVGDDGDDEGGSGNESGDGNEGGSGTGDGNGGSGGTGSGSTDNPSGGVNPGAGEQNSSNSSQATEQPTAPTAEMALQNNPGLPGGTAEESKNSEFATLAARVSKTTKNSNTIKWSKVKDADGYLVFGNKCNAKGKKYQFEVLDIIEKNSTTSYTHKGLAKGTGYKYLVQAYRMKDGQLEILSTSKSMHAITKGGKYGNTSALKLNKSKVSLKVGRKLTLKVKETVKGGKKSVHRKVAFESSNTKIATVTGKGVIKAKKKGTCDIYVYAQNGVYKKVKVTVKK